MNLYVPELVKVLDVIDETADVKTFACDRIGNGSGSEWGALPGQFVEVSMPGFGEIPIGIASAYDRDGRFDITVRKVGSVTGELHRVRPGQVIGIRGPLGNYFPFEAAQGREPIFVAGGIGLPPLRSLIHFMLARPTEYPKLTILYGARTPADLVYKDELKRWQQDPRIDFHLTVDIGDAGWKGNVGLVTELFKEIRAGLSQRDRLRLRPTDHDPLRDPHAPRPRDAPGDDHLHARAAHEVRGWQVRALRRRPQVRLHRRAGLLLHADQGARVAVRGEPDMSGGVIIGIGNELRGDDAAGLHVARDSSEPARPR